jgi:hypothetical protein
MSTPEQDQLHDAIDEGTSDPRLRQDSRLILQALQAKKDQLKGETALPQDQSLSERILADARRRSAQISASRGGTGHRAQAPSRSIPWWMIIAWLVAIAAVVLIGRMVL